MQTGGIHGEQCRGDGVDRDPACPSSGLRDHPSVAFPIIISSQTTSEEIEQALELASALEVELIEH